MCARQRRQLPSAVANAPELDLGLEFYQTAFWELSSCRSIGFGFGPIPWSEIYNYAAIYGLVDSEDIDEFVYIIRAMDRVFIEYHIEQAKNPPPEAKK